MDSRIDQAESRIKSMFNLFKYLKKKAAKSRFF